MKTIYTLLLLSFFLTTVQSQNVDLSLRLEKGKEYKQTTSTKSSVIQEVMGQNMDMYTTVNGTMSFLVKEIIKDGYVMEAKYEHLSMSMKMPQGAMEMSSENSSNSPLSSFFKDIKGKTFEVTITKKGKVTEVKNYDKIMETAVQSFEGLPEVQKEQMKAQMMKAYGDEAIKTSMELITAIYPDKPVKKGDKWIKDSKLESGMSVDVSTVYELAEVTKDYAMINGSSTLITADKDAYIEYNGMAMKFDLSGTMLSEIKIDLKTGWIIQSDTKQELEGDAKIKESPQLPEGLKVLMKIINETVVTNN